MTLWLGLAFAQQYRAPFSDAHYGYFYPTAYYDHSGVDWACGGIRYSGHRGSDFGGGSFSGMDAGRDLVAAAEGVVVATNDGEFDRCESGECGGGGGFGNYVAVQHQDGKVTYYAHMKKWSVAVSNGQHVSCGQKLGQMGSSGWSTGPHIHFGVKKNGSYVDPFDGACSGPPTYWTSQGSHGGLPGKGCEVYDSDGDGTRDDQDCAPNDKNVHPGATEICGDGIDNDCSGGDRASEVAWVDADGDGYGAGEVRFCGSLPGGVVRTPGDCDDGRRSVNPGAHELCDGLDNDCNGLIDDGPPTEMADPPPRLAARLVDASYPAPAQGRRGRRGLVRLRERGQRAVDLTLAQQRRVGGQPLAGRGHLAGVERHRHAPGGCARGRHRRVRGSDPGWGLGPSGEHLFPGVRGRARSLSRR